MARNISVKVPTSLLVEQIENKIAEIDRDIAEYPAKRKQYEQDMEKYKDQIVSFVSHYLEANRNRVGFGYDDIIRINERYTYNGTVDLTINTEAIEGFPKRPEMPTMPNQNQHFGRDYTTQKSLLEKNLTILKMTSQEEVNASTYGAIMEIL